MTVTANGLDELKALAGADLGHTDWLEITQDRVNAFADATSDHQQMPAQPFGGVQEPPPAGCLRAGHGPSLTGPAGYPARPAQPARLR